MTEMVERVARALFTADGGSEWGEVHAEAQLPWLLAAKVAIAAMREPTEAMVEVVRRFDDINSWGIDHKDALEQWAAMIDAALAEQ